MRWKSLSDIDWSSAHCLKLPLALADGLFFREDRYDQAKKHCADCPLKAECAELGAFQTVGVFGGLTPSERPQKTSQKRQRPSHGMNSRYVDGCRCELCTAAHRRDAYEYEARRRRNGNRRQSRIPNNLPHRASGEGL